MADVPPRPALELCECDFWCENALAISQTPTSVNVYVTLTPAAQFSRTNTTESIN